MQGANVLKLSGLEYFRMKPSFRISKFIPTLTDNAGMGRRRRFRYGRADRGRMHSA